MNEFEQIFNIDYSDIEENHKLSNTNFLKFMQEVASLHSDALGYGLEDLSKINLGWVITHWKLQVYLRPKYGEKIVVRTWVRKVDKIFFYRDFEVYNEKKERIAIATSKWIWMNLTKKNVQRIDKEVIEKYKTEEKSVLQEYKFNKIKEPQNFDNQFEYTIQRRDIDTNHHVNNLNYLDFAYEALPEEIYNNIDFKNIEIEYKKEIKPKEKIICLYNEKENIVVIKSINENQTNAIIKLDVKEK